MDTSDPHIQFDDEGLCEYCVNYDAYIGPEWKNNISSNTMVNQLADHIKETNTSSDFDCIIGLSGGLDSSYTAYMAVKKMGLKPLLLHVDAGWNTDAAVANIEKLVDHLNLDLYTAVVDWDAVKRMQVAFLRSGIPDQDLVQDAAFFSELYKFARKYKVKHILTGSNYSTECCREPEEWGGYLGIDKTLFKDIWRQFGDGGSIDNFPIVDILKYKVYYQKLLGMRVHYPLNLVNYKKSVAESKLNNELDWEPFKHKHHESRFTRFYEDFWLPKRFGYDKRRAHFSSLIMTQQMSREDALTRISRTEMDDHFLKLEFEYVANKLDLTIDELNDLLVMPKYTYKN